MLFYENQANLYNTSRERQRDSQRRDRGTGRQRDGETERVKDIKVL